MDISVFYLTFRAQEAMEIQTNQLRVIIFWSSFSYAEATYKV